MSDDQNTVWEINERTATDYLIEATDPAGWYKASVRFDGCIDFYRYFNSPLGYEGNTDSQLVDRLHICDIGDVIERLQKLKDTAREHFHEDWPEL